MTKINGGATLWARQTIDSDIFYNKPDKWFKIWFYLINEVNHKSNKQFARGSCFMKYEWIIKKTKATKNEVDHCIRWLKSATMITTTKATRGFIIKVNNYNDYQSLESYKSDTRSDSKSDLKATQKRHRSDTEATLLNKNDNNDKNEKNDKNKEEIKYIYSRWNEQKIIVHKIFDDYKVAIKTAINKYGEGELEQAIINYDIILKGKDYYFNYKWTLNDFLKRGVDKFLDLEIAKNNYKKGDQNGRSRQSNDQSKKPGEDKYKHLEETY